MSSKYPLVSLLFTGVLIAVAILNAFLTAVFGANYLFAAFGREGFLPSIAGALYALLILDIAGYAYIGTYAKTAETKLQRSISLSVGILCLLGSIAVTVVQLSNTAFGLTALAGYEATIEFIALVLMIALTAIHAAVLSSYFLLSAKGQAKQKAIDIKANVTNDALAELEAQMSIDAAKIAEHMSANMRREILQELGFNDQLQPVSKIAAKTAVSNGTAPKVVSR